MKSSWNRTRLVAATTLPFAVLIFYLFYQRAKKETQKSDEKEDSNDECKVDVTQSSEVENTEQNKVEVKCEENVQIEEDYDYKKVPGDNDVNDEVVDDKETDDLMVDVSVLDASAQLDSTNLDSGFQSSEAEETSINATPCVADTQASHDIEQTDFQEETNSFTQSAELSPQVETKYMNTEEVSCLIKTEESVSPSLVERENSGAGDTADALNSYVNEIDQLQRSCPAKIEQPQEPCSTETEQPQELCSTDTEQLQEPCSTDTVQPQEPCVTVTEQPQEPCSTGKEQPQESCSTQSEQLNKQSFSKEEKNNTYFVETARQAEAHCPEEKENLGEVEQPEEPSQEDEKSCVNIVENQQRSCLDEKKQDFCSNAIENVPEFSEKLSSISIENPKESCSSESKDEPSSQVEEMLTNGDDSLLEKEEINQFTQSNAAATLQQSFLTTNESQEEEKKCEKAIEIDTNQSDIKESETKEEKAINQEGIANSHEMKSNGFHNPDSLINVCSLSEDSNVESILPTTTSQESSDSCLVSSSESDEAARVVTNNDTSTCGSCSEKENKKQTSTTKPTSVDSSVKKTHLQENINLKPRKDANSRNSNNNNTKGIKRSNQRFSNRNNAMIQNGWSENASTSSNEGSVENFHKKRLKYKKGEKESSPGKEEKKGELEVFVEFPASCVGLLIGKQGKNIKQLKYDSGAEIFVHETEDNNEIQVLQIKGTEAEVESCAHRIKRRFSIPTLAPYSNDKKLKLLAHTTKPAPTSNTNSSNPSPAKRNHSNNHHHQQHPRQIHHFPSLPPTQYLVLPKGKLIDVFISAISNVDCVFVQQCMDPTYASLHDLQIHMELCYNKENNAPQLPRPIRAGFICVVEQNEVWYRSEVVSYCNDSDQLTVRFLDYGGYSNVSYDSCRQIREDLLNLPYQAVECFLDNISPIEDDDNDSKLDRIVKFQALLKDGSYKARVTSYQNSFPVIQLYKVYGAETKLVNAEIAKHGIGNWVQTSTPVM